MLRKENLTLHLGWVVFLLVLTIVALLSLRWGASDGVCQYVGFAAAVASTILAVLAIVYAYISNASLSGTMGKIDNAADSLTRVAQDISTSTTELRAKVEALPAAIQDVRQRVDGVQQQIKETMDTLSDQGQTATVKQKEKAVPAAVGDAQENRSTATLVLDIDKFLAVTSLRSLFLLYALAWIHRRQVGTTMADLANKVGGTDEYLYGFLIACHSVGLLVANENQGVWTVPSMHPRIPERIQAALDTRADQLHKEHPVPEPSYRSAVDKLKASYPES